MRVITCNTNGIRSARDKGFFGWLAEQQADVVCVQETKAQEADLAHADFRPPGWHCHYFSAERRGYAGVALYSRREPEAVLRGFGAPEFDAEGRYLETRFGRLSVVCLYLPSGSAGPERQASKDRFLQLFPPHLQALRQAGREVLLCGDFNIAHTARDLKNWKGNQKNSGFLPHERAWMDQLLGPGGYVDVYRRLHPEAEGEGYTWWSNRGQAWAKNVGWRIDYHLATPALAATARAASVFRDRRFSDHAPLTVEYQWP
jgi:exodeoxyribonuclease-3